MQHLERHRALVPEVPGQVHRGHAPAAQLALQQVAVRESGLEERREVGHLLPVADEPRQLGPRAVPRRREGWRGIGERQVVLVGVDRAGRGARRGDSSRSIMVKPSLP